MYKLCFPFLHVYKTGRGRLLQIMKHQILQVLSPRWPKCEAEKTLEVLLGRHPRRVGDSSWVERGPRLLYCNRSVRGRSLESPQLEQRDPVRRHGRPPQELNRKVESACYTKI